MASFEQVLKFEKEKPQGAIRLVEANGFYRAYEQSAFLFHQAIAQHKVTRKFVKPFRTYVASRSLRRIRRHLGSITPRMCAKRAQAVVNSSLGVLSHYDSYNVRRVVTATCWLSRFGRFSEDGLRYYPNALDWAIYRFKRGVKQ